MSDALPPLIDRAVLAELVDGIGTEGTHSVIELFVAEIGTYLEVILAGAAAPEDAAQCDQARRAAHSLKSGAGQVGAAAVAAAASEVERVAAESASDLPAAARALHKCVGETAVAYQDFLAE